MTPEQLDVELAELETRLERLRSLYEQYFSGIERIPPGVVRKDVDRRFWQLRHENIRNTGKRFKLQTLIQRYGMYQQYWQRICREIENGTYRRQLLRVERRSQIRGERADPGPRAPVAPAPAARAKVLGRGVSASPEPESPSPKAPASQPAPSTALELARHLADVDLGAAIEQALDAAFAAPGAASAGAPAEAPRRLGRLRPPPKRTGPEGMLKNLDLDLGEINASKEEKRPAPKLGATRIHELHNELVLAKSRVNDATEVSEKTLMKSIRVAERKLRKKHGDRAIDFTVVVKGGKAILKPVIR